MIYGYARVSSKGQDLAVQKAALKQAGCTVIRAEKASGTKTEGRPELATLLEFMGGGDSLVITRIDRLARSTADFHNILAGLEARGITLKATDQPVDTSTPTGKLIIGVLALVAEFETALRKERQAEGIEAAKEKGGVYKGGKARIDAEKVRSMLAGGMRPTDVARTLGIARGSVYRLLDAGTSL